MATATVVTGNKVQGARLLVLRQGLKLEIKGLTRRGRSCYAIIKDELGFKGSKQSVLDQFTAYLQDEGILRN